MSGSEGFWWGGGRTARATGLRDKRTGKGRVQRSREQLSIKDGNVSATALCSRPWELLALHCIRMPFSLAPSSAQPAVLPLLVTGQSSTAEVNETFISRRLTADKLLKLDTVRMKSRPAYTARETNPALTSSYSSVLYLLSYIPNIPISF